jgi:hypothetical protein
MCVRRQTDGLTEHESHDKKYNDDDDGGDHNISFHFINLQAIITIVYYKTSTKTQNTKTVQIHGNNT